MIIMLWDFVALQVHTNASGEFAASIYMIEVYKV